MKKQQVSFEQAMWQAANKLRKNIDPSAYKHVVLGLLFLKHVSDSTAKANGIIIPSDALWQNLKASAGDKPMGEVIDAAITALETQNPSLSGILPKGYAQHQIGDRVLLELMNLFDSMGSEANGTGNGDVLGRVYEYFLGEFAAAEGKRGGQYYTPPSVVQLLVELLQPYQGKVYDPCCGTGGMFVQSEKFVLARQGQLNDISLFGQESNQRTFQLCRMNLALRGINHGNIRFNPDGTFLDDAHPQLKADFILANPPFNTADWGHEHLSDDSRWKFGIPPKGNANFAWIQHILAHLAPDGYACLVLSNGSLSTQGSKERIIRQKIVSGNFLDCIVMLPDRLFINTGIPACVWLLTTSKCMENPKSRKHRKNEILFIEAGSSGRMVSRKNRVLTADDIGSIASIYHNWKTEPSDYSDIAGLCRSVSIDEVARNDFFLTPGRYVGVPPIQPVDAEEYRAQLAQLRITFQSQFERSAELGKQIMSNWIER